ncbi:MAG: RpiB/LacA/LacB family sugar-phosphate isomerase [Lachnospiraceae bacterium]|jgi:ribose 5-phosphate isomerase RpiB|nr:RpiB/LacA/LacB family sugar-phosphate isomerase [Lachnospiraceae bacterium]
MKIAVVQASSQKEKNQLFYESVVHASSGQKHEVINFGIFSEETVNYSYVQIALQVCLLLESGAVDFVVTGCSSGQGMMLACNSLPGILCGYVQNPSDAYLFGRINDGNAVSYPLGLNFGWAGEINLNATMERLFQDPFGCGYPKGEAARKRRDTEVLKNINRMSKGTFAALLPRLEHDLVESLINRKIVCDYVMQYGTNHECLEALENVLRQKEDRT